MSAEGSGWWSRVESLVLAQPPALVRCVVRAPVAWPASQSGETTSRAGREWREARRGMAREFARVHDFYLPLHELQPPAAQQYHHYELHQ